MKLLLASAGVKNPTIRDALVDMLRKPIAESSALCIPTAQYGHPSVGPGIRAWQFISGNSNPMVDLGELCRHLGANRAAQHRQGTLDAAGQGDRRLVGGRR